MGFGTSLKRMVRRGMEMRGVGGNKAEEQREETEGHVSL